MKKINVISYNRVSTENQDTLRQERDIETYCKNNNFKVIRKISEKVSGTVSWENRELKSVFGGEDFEGIIVSELSRLGRNTSDVLNIIKKLTEKKIWVYSISNNLRTLDEDGKENPMAKLLLTILSGIAELEKTTIKERTLSGLASSIKSGNWTGGKYLPYGYKRENKKLVIDIEEAEIVKKIFSLHQSGHGTTRIANILNQQKVKTRYNKVVEDKVVVSKLLRDGDSFKWVGGTIYSILTNPVYIGEKQGRKKLKGLNIQSPVLIDKDVFELTQIRLKETNTRTSTRFLYVLHGKTKCGCCGLTYFPHKRISNKDNAYKCLSIRYGNSCGNFGIGIPRLNNGVWTSLRKNQEQIENILEINKNKNAFQKDILELKSKSLIIENEIQELKQMEQRILDLYLKGNYDTETLNKNHSEITNSLNSKQAEISIIKDEIISKKDFITKQFTATNYLKRIKDDPHILKKTFEKVINKILIYPIEKNDVPNIFTNKQDKLVYVELYTYVNINKPLSFVISQRSTMILSVNDEVVRYNKESKTLSLLENEFEEEEEADIVYYELLQIDNLTKTLFIKPNSNKKKELD